MTPDPPTSINELDSKCLSVIFSHLGPACLGAASCVQRQWRDHLSSDDSVWRGLCEARLGMGGGSGGGPVAPDRSVLPTYRAAWLAFQAVLGRYGELGVRAYRAWRQVEDWLEEHMPEVAASLRPGVSEEALAQAERELGVVFPPALRALYRLHDGQALAFDAMVDNQRTAMHPSIFHGLFGGYSFYSHLVSTRMLPLRRLVRWTRHFRGALALPESRVLFAANFNFNKMVWCDLAEGGRVKISCVDKLRCLGAVPPAPVGVTGPAATDGMLRWFEAYAAALGSGRFAVELLDPELPQSRAITLYPQLPPWQSEAVTRGVRVRALPVFVPELTQLAGGEEGGDGEEEGGAQGGNQYFFTYSVRFDLLPEEEQAARWAATAGPFRPLASVQLRSRHWLIRDARGAVESEVRGEAVVGHYPLLRAGGQPFAYQSCTHQREVVGSMEGDFTFVEGTLQQPAGPAFESACAPFRLDVPEIIF